MSAFHQAAMDAKMFCTDYTSSDGAEFKCYWSPDGEDPLAAPESITLEYALVGNKDHLSTLNQDTIDNMEEEAWGHIAQEREGDDYDRGEDRYEARQEAQAY